MVNPELVDDLISGGETTKQTLEIKMTATAILGEATFKLHKWNSNNQKLVPMKKVRVMPNDK